MPAPEAKVGPDAYTFVIGRPAPPLRAWVDRYVGYRLIGPAPGRHRGLPSRHLTFVASIGSPVDVVAQTDPGEAPAAYGCVVGGLQASSAVIAHDGRQEGVEVELTPLGSRAVFGTPARALWDRSFELADVVGGVGRELWERLQHTVTWPERFAVCDDVLSQAADVDTTRVELKHCWGALVASGGRVRIDELAAGTGWSRQHLTRRFRDEFGLTPKLAARIVRFERASRQLQAGGAPSVAEVAAMCGYHDQAHLHRDVVALAGCTPTQLTAEPDPPGER